MRNINDITVGTTLVCDELHTPLQTLLDCGIDVIGIDENGFRVRRRHPSYNGEEFFLTRDAMTRSHWTIAKMQEE